jgi:hypothetical protein
LQEGVTGRARAWTVACYWGSIIVFETVGMSGDLFQLDLIDTMDKLSFDAKGIQLSCTSKSLKEVVEFLFGFICYVLLGQER